MAEMFNIDIDNSEHFISKENATDMRIVEIDFHLLWLF